MFRIYVATNIFSRLIESLVEATKLNFPNTLKKISNKYV